jgi:hypothetical protein
MKCALEVDRLPISWEEKLAYLTIHFLEEEQKECPLKHSFDEDMYVREIFIPKETLFIGRPHRHGHQCELVSGKVLHITPEYKHVVEAPFSMMSTPKYQMVLYTMTDIVGRNYYPAGKTRDVQILEDEMFESVESMKALGSQVASRIGYMENPLKAVAWLA